MVVEVTPGGVEVVPEGVDVVPEGVLVCGALEPLVAVEPVIDGLVVLTAPALPVVPVVPVAEGVVCVADGVVCVADGVVCVADGLPAAPALPVVWAAATPMASVNAKAIRNLLFIVSLKPACWGLLVCLHVLNDLDARSQMTGWRMTADCQC